MIFDILTSPQGHQFDQRATILLLLCSTHQFWQFDIQQDHAHEKY